MNVYSELWELLRPRQDADAPEVLFGTLSGVSPLRVTVGDTVLSQGLYFEAGRVFRTQDIGRTVALLPCEEGFLILFFVGENA